jgi:hypothetical protein
VSDCEEVAVIVTVRVEEWELEDAGRVVSVGGEMSSWLTFQEAAAHGSPTELVQVLAGVARPLPSWPGAIPGRHPVQIDVEEAALYWDAPQPVDGAVEVTGMISSNNMDAPDGFPETRGVVRRVRMGWSDYAAGRQGSWTHDGGPTRYEDVSASYFPQTEAAVLDPQVERALARRARQAFKGETPDGRRLRGADLTIGFKASGTATEVPSGTIQTRWTGVLVDLEITGSSRS